MATAKLSSAPDAAATVSSDAVIVVVSGSSGSGKSTILKELMARHPLIFAYSISHTTRGPRVGEKEGIDYHFIQRAAMDTKIAADEFLEYAEFAGNLYGTSRRAVQEVVESGKTCILDVDLAGVKSVKSHQLPARYVFIRPPSVQILEERLRNRGTETDEKVQLRMARVKMDLEYADQNCNYDIQIINDDLDTAVSELERFLHCV